MAKKGIVASNALQCFPAGKNESGIRSYNCYDQPPECRARKQETISKCADNVFKNVQGAMVNGIIKDIGKASYKIGKGTCIEKKVGSNTVVSCKTPRASG